MAPWFEAYVLPLMTLLAGAGGVWAFLKVVAASRATTAVARVKQPADMLGAMAAFQEQLNKQAQEITADLRHEVDRLMAEAKSLQARVTELEEENLECRGENRQMQQRLESLEAHLRRRGVDVPGPGMAGTLTVFEGGEVSVFQGRTLGDESHHAVQRSQGRRRIFLRLPRMR